MTTKVESRHVKVQCDGITLDGGLNVPENASGLILFAHGSGSSRKSPRNRYVAEVLNETGIATLLFDLLTMDEESVDAVSRELRFDIPMLAERLQGAVEWTRQQSELQGLKIGLFGASTGAAAALIAAAKSPDRVVTVVSRGGRPDLADQYLSRVKAPTLLIVGGNDHQVIEMNREAQSRMEAESRLEIVPGATHLFEEPGKLEQVARLARDWFSDHLR